MENNMSKRLTSLDALRGFDMLYLVAISYVFLALPKVADIPLFNWLHDQCEHPGWRGFTMYDIVFPMFIFIVGVAMPFSFTKRMQQEGGRQRLFRHVMIRTITLMILGVVLWQESGGPHPEWGFYSVLYRIGIAYFFAALILMNTGIRGQVYWAFGLLFGYWVLIRFVPVPGHSLSEFSHELNFGVYFEGLITSWLSRDFRYVIDPSLMQAVANCVLGVLAGHWLMSDRSPEDKARGLMYAGIAFIIAALVIHMDIPFYKKPGQPTFHFMTVGISTTLLAAFYWIIDVRGHKKWAFFLIVVGVNPITIYVAGFLIGWNGIANVFVGAFDFGNAQDLMIAIVAGVIKWLFLYYLWRQKVFLKI